MTDYSTGYKHGKRDAIDGCKAKPERVSRTYRDGYYDAYDAYERKKK